MPRHLFGGWEEIAKALRDRYVILFLDYDGTLSPIAERPEMAKLLPGVRNVLKELSRQRGVKIAVISGRALNDLEQRVRIPGLTYAGNHGFELRGTKIRYAHPAAEKLKRVLRKIAGRLKNTCAAFPGIILENKLFTISIHYRQASPKIVNLAKKLLLKTIGPHLEKSQIVLREGKKVWEVRPAVAWDKGKIVLWFLAQFPLGVRKRILPVYIGDDRTDEDAFRVLKRRGLGVKVTENFKRSTQAGYCLDSPGEVFEFLKRLARIKAAGKYKVETVKPKGN
ncbi:MAG: trehalose-phosphatase [Omnitrophica bacterium GWA2_52_8]|nr:MAG: trehalose-phosphatase [Omnitrophica bacterium GWA2_52_8]